MVNFKDCGVFLSHVCLEVQSLRSLTKFYTRCVGMTIHDEKTLGNRTVIALGFTPRSTMAAKLFHRATTLLELWSHDSIKSTYQHSKDSVYWKIGVTLSDVKLACKKLADYGIKVSTPAQFRDIGFLCHLTDPDGFIIELLQHEFESNHQAVTPNMEYPLGQFATLGQVTLRVSNISASLNFYQETLGMSLLSIQDVSVYGFTLYFLAWTDERPPNEDITSVGIREWLWRRPYTLIELQHMHKLPPKQYEETRELPGFKGLRVMTTRLSLLYGMLQNKGHKLTEICENEFYEANTFTVFDPDGIPVIFTEYEQLLTNPSS